MKRYSKKGRGRKKGSRRSNRRGGKRSSKRLNTYRIARGGGRL